MKAHQAAFTLTAMCRVLGLSTSGYHDWLHRRRSQRTCRDDELKVRIKAIWRESDETYGVVPGSTRRCGPKATGWVASGSHA